jgi:adenosylhomocysteine nucleosidase
VIGIIGAMEEEVSILRSVMQNVKIEKTAVFEFILGSLENKDIVLLRCGIGKVNAAVGCAVLLERYKTDFIINTGCAGGVNPAETKIHLNFGDVVISSGLVQHDFDLTAFGYEMGQVPAMSPIFEVPVNLIDAAAGAIDQLKNTGMLPADLKYVDGLIGSGDVFMCQKSRIDSVLKMFPKIRALEMEGAAMAQTCALFNVPFIAIRALSDIAGEESPLVFDEYLPIAAKNSSEIVKKIVKNY